MSAVLDTHTDLWYLENSKELSALARTSGMLVAAVDANVADALPNIPRDVVPDMPDRILAATALHLCLPLVTRDRRLQSAGIQTIR